MKFSQLQRQITSQSYPTAALKVVYELITVATSSGYIQWLHPVVLSGGN